jgi:AraC-like DNA-binding protein
VLAPPPSTEKDTVSVQFAVCAVRHLPLEARVRVLHAAGIQPELLEQPRVRVPGEAFSALWLGVAREMDDEFFGLDTRRMKVGSFSVLTHSLLACGTLERALRQLLRGFTVILDDVNAELSCDGEHACITLHNRITDAQDRRFAEETLLVMIHGLMCWLVGRRIALTHATFAGPQPEHSAEYALLFCNALSFDTPHTRVFFNAEALPAPVVQTLASLRTFLQNAPQSVFLKYKNEQSWTAKLRRKLRTHQGSQDWPTLEDMAQAFHMAPNTLRRRLEAEGESYQSLKDHLRRDLAIHHLCSSPLGVAEIGALLGFQEPSAFYRAFKRWCGVQPGAYRAQQRLQQARPSGQNVADSPQNMR